MELIGWNYHAQNQAISTYSRVKADIRMMDHLCKYHIKKTEWFHNFCERLTFFNYHPPPKNKQRSWFLYMPEISPYLDVRAS